MDIKSYVKTYFEQIDWNQEPKNLYEPIDYALQSGGKRIRPTLVLMAAKMFGGDVEKCIKPAAAMEIFHNFTLLHDDVMDNATVRRGKPSVFGKWGTNAALLSGDAMMIYSYKLLQQTPVEYLPAVLGCFNYTAMTVCEGQQVDMEFEKRSDVTLEEYMSMIDKKTAALLAGAPMIGAIQGGADPQSRRELFTFATELGLAFQLQDDLLDVYADQSLFGKKIGGDICCNKKTFLLITAMNLASAGQLATMKEWMEKSEFDADAKIAYFTNLYNELGVREICERRIQALFDECDGYMEKLSVAPEKKIYLKEFADSLLNRNL